MCITNYVAFHLKRIPPASKSPLFNSEAVFPSRFSSLARTGLKAGYRSVPLMSPLSLLLFQANYISSGAALPWPADRKPSKAWPSLRCHLSTGRQLLQRLIRSSGCHRKHRKLATAPIFAWKHEENLPNTHAGGYFWIIRSIRAR